SETGPACSLRCAPVCVGGPEVVYDRRIPAATCGHLRTGPLMAVSTFAPPPAAAAVSAPAELVQHWIGGRPASGAGARLPLFNPATGAVTRQVVMGGEEDVRAAVASAQAAWHSWAETAPVRRAR